MTSPKTRRKRSSPPRSDAKPLPLFAADLFRLYVDDRADLPERLDPDWGRRLLERVYLYAGIPIPQTMPDSGLFESAARSFQTQAEGIFAALAALRRNRGRKTYARVGLPHHLSYELQLLEHAAEALAEGDPLRAFALACMMGRASETRHELQRLDDLGQRGKKKRHGILLAVRDHLAQNPRLSGDALLRHFLAEHSGVANAHRVKTPEWSGRVFYAWTLSDEGLVWQIDDKGNKASITPKTFADYCTRARRMLRSASRA